MLNKSNLIAKQKVTEAYEDIKFALRRANVPAAEDDTPEAEEIRAMNEKFFNIVRELKSFFESRVRQIETIEDPGSSNNTIGMPAGPISLTRPPGV